MARGGGKNSPVIGDNGITATPEEIRKLTKYALDVFQATPPDLHDPEAVQTAIIDYFKSCDARGVRPGNLGLYAALGMSKQDYNNAVTGRSKSKVSPACLDLIKKAVRAMGAFREGLALEGRLNPVTYIFMGKNYDGLEDQTRIEVTATQGPTAQLTPEEIAKQIEQDIPIDADYTTAPDADQ